MAKLKHSNHPRTAFVEVLYACNLFCTYCYIGNNKNHIQPVVPSFEKIRDSLQHLRKAGVEEIVLLGGEPTLHPKFKEICQLVDELGFPYRGIVTNGTQFTESLVNDLKNKRFWVDISFRGPDAASFDATAGKSGAFQKAFDAAILLSNAGMQTGIEFDCIPENYREIYATIDMLVKAGVRIKQLQLHRIIPEGNADGGMDKFQLSLDQWQLVFEQAARIRDEFQMSVVFEDGFPLCLVDSKYWNLLTPCPCGLTLVTVSPNGDVRYCPCHPEAIGNLSNSSLESLWEDNLAGYRDISRLPSACRECDLVDVCRGGCSASGHTEMNKGTDVFQSHFKSLKLDGEQKTQTKLIIGQGVDLV